jgi:subtilisin family serine protease
MNVGPAWQKGYTGKGVVVSILDDGIQRNHPDLDKNYVSLLFTFSPSLLNTNNVSGLFSSKRIFTNDKFSTRFASSFKYGRKKNFDINSGYQNRHVLML